MAVNQYIGARYVTKFADPIEWSNTKNYEALTVVQHQGDSYVSKQAVPVGVDIADTRYWLHWADYNAQIEQYRREVANIVENVGNVLPFKQFAFETAIEMQESTNLTIGSIVTTSGFYNANDGGGAVYIITNKANPNGYNELPCGNLTAELINFDSNFVPECYGAHADGVTDDTDVIQFIIDYYAGGNVAFNCKTYAISRSILMRRGMRLLGAATYDDFSDKSSTCIKMLPHSNQPMVVTPAVQGLGGTHYLVIENIFFDCNGSNQDLETIAIYFRGAYIGSAIKNVYIKNFYGTALNLQYADVDIHNLWIQNGWTTHDAYAMCTNMELDAPLISCLANMSHVYIENYSNKIGGNPRDNVEDRANGLYLKSTTNANISELHFEACKNAITIDAPWVVNLNSAHCAWCGNGEGTAFIRILNPARVTNIFGIQITSSSRFSHWVYKDGFASNEIPNIPYSSNNPALSMLTLMKSELDNKIYMHESVFSNNLDTERIGNTDYARYRQYSDVESTDDYAYMKTSGAITKFGSKKNQSSEKDFIEYQSLGGNGDRIVQYEPVYMPNARNSAADVYRNSLYHINFSRGEGLAFQRVTGSNDGTEMLATVTYVSGAPTQNAYFVGQIAIDVPGSNVYIATKIGTGSNDWVKLN